MKYLERLKVNLNKEHYFALLLRVVFFPFTLFFPPTATGATARSEDSRKFVCRADAIVIRVDLHMQ